MRTADWANGYCPYMNVDISLASQDNNQATYSYAVKYCTTSGGAAYTNGNNRAWSFSADGKVIASGSININGRTTFDVASGTFSISKSQSSRDFGVSVTMEMDVTWAGVYAASANGSGTIHIDARQYYAHGKPSFSASKTTVHYGESIKLSWGKSETQGNANFDHFELWQGSTKLYNGSNTSYTVKPSDVTGAKGGTAKYVLKEIHEWYGELKTTEASVSIKVQSGVVTMYDLNGVKHVGLVTVYDSKGVKHYVLITAYDKDGKAHNVV